MDFSILEEELSKNLNNLDAEFRRLFHGRGGLWQEWRFLTVDSIDRVLLMQFFYDIDEALQNKLKSFFLNFIQNTRHETIVLKHRYVKGSKTELLYGAITGDEVALENGMRFSINLLKNQNIGYFGDMKNGRAFIESIANGKNVLNLFSYTCGFSLFAKRGGARHVVNVDMSKSVLATGMKNHALNGLETKGVSFLPYNILKSFGRLKKKGPFDIVVIDPPTFQKGSFEASKDYEKIIQKLPQLTTQNATVLACLNSPDLDESFLISQFERLAPSFCFTKRILNPKEYKSLNDQTSLKSLVFTRKNGV